MKDLDRRWCVAPMMDWSDEGEARRWNKNLGQRKKACHLCRLQVLFSQIRIYRQHPRMPIVPVTSLIIASGVSSMLRTNASSLLGSSNSFS
jgi:hypothetical protein